MVEQLTKASDQEQQGLTRETLPDAEEIEATVREVFSTIPEEATQMRCAVGQEFLDSQFPQALGAKLGSQNITGSEIADTIVRTIITTFPLHEATDNEQLFADIINPHLAHYLLVPSFELCNVISRISKQPSIIKQAQQTLFRHQEVAYANKPIRKRG